MCETDKKLLLKDIIEHIDIRLFDARPIIEAYGRMAFQARNLHNASAIFNRMLKDDSCSIMLTLAGSLFSAGLKNVVTDMIRYNMVDMIISTGAIIVDQDFFEGIGYHHYLGDPSADDNRLRELHIDRIYDTYINEDELRKCDLTVAKIADSLQERSYSSREFIKEMGAYLEKHYPKVNSVIFAPKTSAATTTSWAKFFGTPPPIIKRPVSWEAILISVSSLKSLTESMVTCPFIFCF